MKKTKIYAVGYGLVGMLAMGLFRKGGFSRKESALCGLTWAVSAPLLGCITLRNIWKNTHQHREKR